jgi:hypothetical protein
MAVKSFITLGPGVVDRQGTQRPRDGLLRDLQVLRAGADRFIRFQRTR